MASNSNWMAGAVKHPGALHRQLGVPQGQKIPAAKLAAAAHSSNPTERKRAQLAQTFKGEAAKRTKNKAKAPKKDPSGY